MINEVSGSMDPNGAKKKKGKERAPVFNVVGERARELDVHPQDRLRLHPLERLGGSGGIPKITRPTLENRRPRIQRGWPP